MKPFEFIMCIYIISFGAICTSSCTKVKRNVEADYIKFLSGQMAFPFDSTEVMYPSRSLQASKKHPEVQLVFFFDHIGCTACEISKLAEYELEYMNSPTFENVKFVYIVTVKSESKNKIYSMFCRYRIKGALYIDTCNKFIQANPYFPLNPLFHTFMVDENGRILIVGNPFTNNVIMNMWLDIKNKRNTINSHR